jgi:DNA repair protein RadA/Sms
MAKVKTVFFCQNCGAQSPKWMGKCPHCQEWNTMVEEVVTKNSKQTSYKKNDIERPKPQKISEIDFSRQKRINTHNNELNRVLGGGLVPGSVVLIGGEPGIGKSTLMLQIALALKDQKVLYISGEESEAQIKMRAERINAADNNCYILTETITQQFFPHIENLQPDILVIDSIQTLTTELVDSSAGTISQIRECATELIKYAKQTATPVFLIGHITKEGGLAGPKILEHMVDTVLQFEGDRNYGYRILRSTKNRFGSTSELGIYEMNSSGLREVNNPSEILISSNEDQLSGVSVSVTIEGIRPLLIESQALVSNATYATPQRSATGFDLRRLHMLLAVLEKRSGIRLGNKDVFLNITGGIKVYEPAIDLGIVSAIISSYEDTNIPEKYCFSAEVGLSGEIRPVNKIQQRISEADKLGFEKIFISGYNKKGIQTKNLNIEVVPVKKIFDLMKKLF